jgi:hypothetical protein
MNQLNAEDVYFTCLNKNYNNLKQVCKDVCKRNKEKYSEDTLNDTVLQIHKIIQKKGKLDDMSDNGIMRYFVRSYVNNLRMEKRYAYYKKRDSNITQEEFNDRHEESLSSKRDKIIKDLLEDFSVLYIMKLVELNFPPEQLYLYKLKMICNKTYKQIHDETKIKKSRDKIIEVNKWVKHNLTRDVIKKEFFEIYGDLIAN